MSAIARDVGRLLPDIILLQEMTRQHWDAFDSELRVVGQAQHAADYTWSAPPGRERYYTMIGVSRRLAGGGADGNSQAVEFTRVPFDASHMGRDLLWTRVDVACGRSGTFPLVLATSHLESLDEARARRKQMQQLFSEFERAEDVVFCGDTNINELVDESSRVVGSTSTISQVLRQHGWHDAWEKLYDARTDPGYTFDYLANGMVAAVDSWATQNKARLRYDRCWLKSKNFAAVKVDLVGIEELSRGGGCMMQDTGGSPPPVYASDHFGLLVTLAEWHQHRGGDGSSRSEP